MNRLRLPVRSLLAALVLGAAACGPSEPARRVILISIDTLRADHLSAYGYERLTSPNLDRLLADSVLFERAYSQASWTLPSHMSMFTSLYPTVHGVIDTDRRLASDIWTLPELLKRQDFETTAFTDGGYIGGQYGFADGFDEYRQEDFQSQSGKQGLEKNYPYIEKWVRSEADESFFLFVHTFDTHGPYRAEGEHFGRFMSEAQATPEGIDALEYLKTLGDSDYLELDRFESLEHVIAAYDGGISFVDHMLGRLFRLFEELGIYDDTMIVVTSDHGESFLDEGVYLGHGAFLHDGEVRVPLIVKFPSNRYGGQRVDGVVESLDILPTILAALQIQRPKGLITQGMDLARLLRGESDVNPIAVSANLDSMDNYALRTSDWTVLSKVPEKNLENWFIKHRMRPRDEPALRARLKNEYQLITTGARPDHNQRAENEEIFTRLGTEFLEWKKAQEKMQALVADPGLRAAMSPEEIEHLKRLGYLGGSSEH